MSIDFAEEKKPARERLLDLLLDGNWHSWKECQSVGGARYSARMLELKRLGHRIETRGEKQSGFDYRHIGVGDPQEKRVKVYLTEADAGDLLSGILTPEARTAISDALGSFQTNKHKL